MWTEGLLGFCLFCFRNKPPVSLDSVIPAYIISAHQVVEMPPVDRRQMFREVSSPGLSSREHWDYQSACGLPAVDCMPDITAIITSEVEIFLLALFGIIAMQLLTGEISTKNLLYGRKNDTGEPIVQAGVVKGRKRDDTLYFSPERVQLLIFTLGAAFYYLTQVLNNPNPGTFPPLPQSWPAVIGGSNAVFLGGKAYSRIWKRNGGLK